MMIRVQSPQPGAGLSIAMTEPDEEGCVMVRLEDLQSAIDHGWKVKHKQEPVAAQPAPPPAPPPPAAPTPAPESSGQAVPPAAVEAPPAPQQQASPPAEENKETENKDTAQKAKKTRAQLKD